MRYYHFPELREQVTPARVLSGLNFVHDRLYMEMETDQFKPREYAAQLRSLAYYLDKLDENKQRQEAHIRKMTYPMFPDGGT